jgi:hypothetical protein
MLDSERWSRLAFLWTDEERDHLTLLWNRLDGAVVVRVLFLIGDDLIIYQGWPDATEGLRALREYKTLVTFSNIPLRTQVDMVRRPSYICRYKNLNISTSQDMQV